MTVVIILWKYFGIIFSNPACADIFERKNPFCLSFRSGVTFEYANSVKACPPDVFLNYDLWGLGIVSAIINPERSLDKEASRQGAHCHLYLLIFHFFSFSIKLQFSHMPLLFISYLFMSVQVLRNAPGTEIHTQLHSEPNGHRLGSDVCNTYSLRGVRMGISP